MSRALIYTVERRDYLFYVRASIGADNRQPKVVRLLIDTGARRTVLPKYLLREFGCNVDRSSYSPATQKRFTRGEASPKIASVISTRFGKRLGMGSTIACGFRHSHFHDRRSDLAVVHWRLQECGIG